MQGMEIELISVCYKSVLFLVSVGTPEFPPYWFPTGLKAANFGEFSNHGRLRSERPAPVIAPSRYQNVGISIAAKHI